MTPASSTSGGDEAFVALEAAEALVGGAHEGGPHRAIMRRPTRLKTVHQANVEERCPARTTEPAANGRRHPILER